MEYISHGGTGAQRIARYYQTAHPYYTFLIFILKKREREDWLTNYSKPSVSLCPL